MGIFRADRVRLPGVHKAVALDAIDQRTALKRRKARPTEDSASPYTGIMASALKP